jgi:hypothetical protein
MIFTRALMVLGLTAVVISGCGGSDSSSSSTSDASNVSTSGGSERSALEPSAEFLGQGQNGKLAKIGKESTAAEREAASLVLERNLNARAAGDWETQCATLASSAVEQLTRSSALTPGLSCPEALETQAKSLPTFALANTMTGPIDALRINQEINGFAFWHGTRGRDFVIPMIKQRGGWKVVIPQEQEIR